MAPRRRRATLKVATPSPPSNSPDTVTDAVLEEVSDIDNKNNPASESYSSIDPARSGREDGDYDDSNSVDKEDENDVKSHIGAKLQPLATQPAVDKRKFGGSSKGRACHRWTPKQEQAAVEEMLDIHAEGDVIGDKAFEELYNRLTKKYPAWNHSASGIHNAWYRRGLAKRVDRAKTRMKIRKELEEEKEDEELGLLQNGKRKRGCTPLVKQSKISASQLSNISASQLSNIPSPAPRQTAMSSSLAYSNPPTSTDPPANLPNFPTVKVNFYHYTKNSCRTRLFESVNTMLKLWSQALATPVFDPTKAVGQQLLVLAFTVGNATKVWYMAHGDHYDYKKFLDLVEKAAAAAGETEVEVNMKAAGVGRLQQS